MNRVLFVCNSVYQVLIASWIKYYYHQNDKADLILSERMNGAKDIASRIQKTSLFDSVHILKVKFSNNSKMNTVKKFSHFNSFAKSISKQNTYDVLYTASLDYFINSLFDYIKRRNHKLVLNYYEDGTASYTKHLEEFYVLFKKPKRIKEINHNNLFKKFTLYNSFQDYYVFNPDMLEWYPKNANLIKLPPIDIDNAEFKSLINTIFDYENISDTYKEEYIFFEESYYADTGYMEDFELIERLSQIVGKENLFIKIHPRNPKNRFKEYGYKTNSDTAIPWEVIAMNTDLSDKVLIAIASSSILNPIQVLGLNIKAYSLLNCLNEKPRLLQSQLSQTVIHLFSNYPDNITICNSIDEICKKEI